jgi:hypothetical protein
VASANFHAMGDTVAIEGIARIELHSVVSPVLDISASAIVYPFRYERAGSHSTPRPQFRRRQPDPGRGRAEHQLGIPVAGSFVGASDALFGLTVELSVTA